MTNTFHRTIDVFRQEYGSHVPDEHSEFSADTVVQIGRHPENDLVLRDQRISRFHATLFHDGRNWHCAAFGANGILSGGLLQTHVRIQHGTTIQFAGDDGPRLIFETAQTSERETIRGSVTLLIDRMQDGSHDSLEQLWARCFATVVRLARQRLSTAAKRVSDEEDVAVEASDHLFQASSSGRLPELSDRESLWRLLITMTTNRAKNVLRHQLRQKRGGGQVRDDSFADVTELGITPAGPNVFDNLMSQQPTPDAIVAINEQMSDWLARLPDDEHQQVALRRMEGFSNGEIAEELGLPLRTVERRVSRIRQEWNSGSPS